ncbi:conserved hypothetical protein [Gloeothece citriformis PCC 7424]|uniref:SseB protein N-terminal domain-containing protein n=1 Tax=Gloeothece citriformis (strain PCC 7424) TaxID=65393 RepID=B7KIT3_GLOC7|nr:hypothetical protein [Gloeothece citriformis]ACK70769.1 conserved hypothetical protein [Gloeothece citriformis PCC 7424]
MKLKKQLQSLIKEAPEHGVSSIVMEKAITPVLSAFAKQLTHPKYYLITNVDGNWLLTTLSHQERPEQEKTVIYAFATPEDARTFQKNTISKLKIIAIPVTHLLFQVFAIKKIDSIIFLPTPGNLEKGIEISGLELQNTIKKQLQEIRFSIA